MEDYRAKGKKTYIHEKFLLSNCMSIVCTWKFQIKETIEKSV